MKVKLNLLLEEEVKEDIDTCSQLRKLLFKMNNFKILRKIPHLYKRKY